MSLSSFASKPLEAVVAANPQTFFQVYWLGSRERVAHVLERAKQAGAAGIILTLDWTFAHRRDWGSPAIPEKIDLKTMIKMAPEAIRRPRWLASFARTGGPPTLAAPNLTPAGGEAPGFFSVYGEWMGTPIASWDDVAWMREQWGGKMMVKGVTRPEDAVHAADTGVDAISVSNHGGNNLDGTPASIRALPDVVDAVGDRLEVVLDGGIRRGSDVVKALALGARAVMIGRAALWGLAANGETGVANVLEILRQRDRRDARRARPRVGARRHVSRRDPASRLQPPPRDDGGGGGARRVKRARPGSSTGQHAAQRLRDVARPLDGQRQAAPEARKVARELGVLLARDVEQDVEPGQPRRQYARVGTGVVHAVREQQHLATAVADPAQLLVRDLERKRDIREPARHGSRNSSSTSPSSVACSPRRSSIAASDQNATTARSSCASSAVSAPTVAAAVRTRSPRIDPGDVDGEHDGAPCAGAARAR